MKPELVAKKIATVAGGEAEDCKVVHRSHDPAVLLDSLEKLRASPPRPSRSYLAPFAEHLVEMRSKRWTYQQMREWMHENCGRRPSTSTLNHFFRHVLPRIQRAGLKHKPSEASTPSVQTAYSMTASKKEKTHANTANEETIKAIRALKNRAVQPNDIQKSGYTFDAGKPLNLQYNPNTKH